LAFRARVILQCAALASDSGVAKAGRTTRQTVGLWRKRFLANGVAGMHDAPRCGRPTRIPEAKINTILTAVVQPPPGRTRWSLRSRGRHVGVSPSKVFYAVWAKNDLKPHLTRTFKLSKDPKFEEKFRDVIGQYLNPPQKAIVRCYDEKTHCHARERTPPGFPLDRGHLRMVTHDDIRHGTVSLFAALNYLDGKIHACRPARQPHQEGLSFLKPIQTQTPKGVEVHLIADNYYIVPLNHLRIIYYMVGDSLHV
jgi:hypothetical protein